MKKFTRTIEDFTCGKCQEIVKGDGYTNHCPKCLWSKHVDINPGDRMSDCGGMMEPIGLDKKGEVFSVIQKCELCEHERKNKLVKGDDFNVAVELLKKAQNN